MRRDIFATPRITEKQTQKQLDSIILYDKVFTFHNAPYIQYLDSYQTDFVFVKDFPKVLASMSEVIDKQNFRELLRCAVRTNLKVCSDGELLNPRAKRLLKNQWHHYLFKDFLGHESKEYIIRGDYFIGKNPVRQIKESLDRNVVLCTNVLYNIQSDVDFRMSTERTFIKWLMDYSIHVVMSKKYK